MHCAPHVLACMLFVVFSLKAFKTLVREIIKDHCLTGANHSVKTTQVYTIPLYYIMQMHRLGFSMYIHVMGDEPFRGSIVSGLRPSSHYDTGAVSVTSIVSIAGKNFLILLA